MASKSKSSFGTRIANAEFVWAQIASYPDFSPPLPEHSAASYRALIDKAKSHDTQVASAAHDYSAAVDHRQKLFDKNPDCLHRIVLRIVAHIASSGKYSKETAVIKAMGATIRGDKPKRKGDEPDAVFNSRVETSFGNRTKVFSDMITTLDKYGAKYNTPGNDINTDNLKIRLQAMSQSTEAVSFAYGPLKLIKDDRAQAYDDLSISTQGIKRAVEFQYSNTSSEFALIKGIAV